LPNFPLIPAKAGIQTGISSLPRLPPGRRFRGDERMSVIASIGHVFH
jgi:hypothetical protein